MTEYLPLRAVFESKTGRSTQFTDVVPEEFTIRLNPRFRTDGHGPQVWSETPIREVELVAPVRVWSEAVWDFVDEPTLHHEVSDEEFAAQVFDALVEAVEDVWIPDEFHYVLHSAGYDSRLMSLAIRELYRRNGSGWLGEVLFVECFGEGPWFRQVMEVEGWGESQYFVYDGYYERTFDFGTAWQRMGAGTFAWPMNLWWEPLEWAREVGLVPDDGQCWSAKGANRAGTMGILGNLQEELQDAPYGIVSSFPLSCDWVFPFADFRYVRALRTYGGGRHDTHFIQDVLDVVEADLQGIPNPDFTDWVRFELPDAVFDKAVSDYRASWYGRELHPYIEFEPKPNVFESYWGHWALASYCEHVREEGRQIHID